MSRCAAFWGFIQSHVALPIVCFFFSSRRRHTRSLCDWSSDVCSSDLGLEQLDHLARGAIDVLLDEREEEVALAREVPVHGRSEERRVGKECRSEWRP